MRKECRKKRKEKKKKKPRNLTRRRKRNSRKVAHCRTHWEKMNSPKFWPIWANMANLPVYQTSMPKRNLSRKMHLKNHMQRRQKRKIGLFMMKR